ncbi:hypothetical protein FA15DRAFT_147827 [Coprinopsis marcescibilis]|uniref:Glycoside hydrolase 131 catalytic N-terminal domain-containing protein n=1 Tax=Coprinopsis marcescibilis TaxID=230819 RepID=A0A5C3L548_COPMA|nr:hypothetical protein FA15DRAFT_147827 [Coprinopsis marcescibilis]
MFYLSLPWICYFLLLAESKILWDGRMHREYPSFLLDVSGEPYLTNVKGPRAASVYIKGLGQEVTPTPLWNERIYPDQPYPAVQTEQAIRVLIGGLSVYKPGVGRPQSGLRRTDLIAHKNGSSINLIPSIGKGRVAFHFSVLMDEWYKPDPIHEYQLVYIETPDKSRVFTLQLGSPFKNPTEQLPAPGADRLKILNHNREVIYEVDFKEETWQNFAVVVDWKRRTLQVFYSENETFLERATNVLPNYTLRKGIAGRGEFHFGLLKFPIVNGDDPEEVRGDFEHHGVQEAVVHSMMYSGVFIENVEETGLSIGSKSKYDV